MVLLTVDFKPNTSHEWAAERLNQIGLSEGKDGISKDKEFTFFANLTGFWAVVRVSDDEEIDYSRKIKLIPRVEKVNRYDTGL